MLIMAQLATSAAEPWMGVLMAAGSAWLRAARLSRLRMDSWASGSRRRRPSSVLT
jgi:hypothetical protein